MKIAIGGASGFIGEALVSSLKNQNHTCITVSRRSVGREVIGWDDADFASVISESDAVINLAGAPVLGGRWTDVRKAEIISSRVRTAEKIASAIASSGTKPRVWINASAVGYYGNREDERLTESSAVGTGFLSEVSQRWEDAVFEADVDVRRVCLRIGVVLGNGGGAMHKMELPFKLGLGGPLGSGKQWMPWIHMDDVIGLIQYAIQHDTVSGPLNVTAPEPITNRLFSKALGKVLRRPAVLPAPAWAIRLVFGEAAEVVLGSQRVIPELALKSGYVFRFPKLEPAFKDLLH